MNRLEKELEEYVKTTPVTEEELEALKELVTDGNSVYTNPSMTTDEHGNPSEFLFDYRYHTEIYKELEKLSGKKKEMYLARLRGEDTIDTLREDLYNVIYERNVYFRVLQKHNLLQEAELQLKQGRQSTFVIDIDDELPFQ